ESAVLFLAPGEDHEAVFVLLRRAEAVDRRDRRDDDYVAPGDDRGRRRVPKAIDVVFSGRALPDVGSGLRDVRLGLIVVVVRDEVLDRVVRKELPELVAELRGE